MILDLIVYFEIGIMCLFFMFGIMNYVVPESFYIISFQAMFMLVLIHQTKLSEESQDGSSTKGEGE